MQRGFRFTQVKGVRTTSCQPGTSVRCLHENASKCIEAIWHLEWGTSYVIPHSVEILLEWRFAQLSRATTLLLQSFVVYPYNMTTALAGYPHGSPDPLCRCSVTTRGQDL